MSISRNSKSGIIKNNSYAYVYSDIFQRRGKGQITHYSTLNLTYPSPAQITKLTLNRIIWGVGTKYYNLADKYYNDSEYWWIIAFFNLKPLESNNRPGDIIMVPTPLENVLRYMNYNL